MTKVYVALAKGGMVHQHVLIIPVTHFPNFVFCPPDVGLELERYIEALRRCYRSQVLRDVNINFTDYRCILLQIIVLQIIIQSNA